MDDKTAELLKELAVKLGTTVEHLWAVLVKQAQVEAVVDCMIIMAALVATIWVVTYLRSMQRKYDDLTDMRESQLAVLVVSGALTFILDIIAITMATELPTLVLNPEYWALHQVLRMMGGR